jgi:hypothetical protein
MAVSHSILIRFQSLGDQNCSHTPGQPNYFFTPIHKLWATKDWTLRGLVHAALATAHSPKSITDLLNSAPDEWSAV